MNVLLYIPADTLVGQRLAKKIRGVVPNPNLEIFSDFDSLCRRLHAALYDLAAAVLLAETQQDLTGLTTLTDLLSGVRVVLVLPDHDPETMQTGYRMQPRFFSYTDSDFTDVAGVLEKMWQITVPASRLSRVSIPDTGKARNRSSGLNS